MNPPQPSIQFHLSTALGLMAVWGLALPTLFYFFHIGNLSHEVVALTFFAGSMALFAVLIQSMKERNETVCSMVFASVILGGIGVYVPCGEWAVADAGWGVPIAIMFRGFQAHPNLMAPFENQLCLLFCGLVLLGCFRVARYLAGMVYRGAEKSR